MADTNSDTQKIGDDVRKLYNDALAAFKRKDYDAARKGFLQAWSLQKVPRIAGNLGRAEMELQKYRDAAEHFSVFLREETGLSDDERNVFLGKLQEAKAHVGTIHVETRPAGAEVRIDGVEIGTVPISRELYLEAGRHTVEARFNHEIVKKEIEARAGDESVVVKLEAPPPKVTPTVVATAAPAGLSLETRPFPAREVILIGGAGLAAIGLGVGIGTGVASLSKQAQQDQCLKLPIEAEQRTCWAQVEPERHGLAEASLASGVLFGIAAASTFTYWLVVPQSNAAKPSLSLRVAPAPAGLILFGAW